MNSKIFIQIASYRDPQLISTIRSMIYSAKNPDNLSIGIAWQHSEEDEWDNIDDFKDDKRFKILDINYKESRGVCWARNMVQQLYDGEGYTLQIDSHHRFAQDWDYELIEMLKKIQEKGHKKPLITAYAPSFDPDNDPKSRVMKPWKMNFDRYTPEGVVFFMPGDFEDQELNEPIPARFYSAHFAFSLGSFCTEVQHDPEYYFHGEEISIAARAFTNGYDLFHPHKALVWHEYTRKNRTKQWDDDSIWVQRNSYCHERNRKLFGIDCSLKDINFGKYDMGKERSLLDYEKYAGLCFKVRGVTQDTLDNIAPNYDNIKLPDYIFYQKIKTIFKHCIDISIDQVPEKDYDFWCVVFKNVKGEELYRSDASEEEIRQMMDDPDGYIKIWRQFNATEKPCSWLVWPHSKSKGWCEQIVGPL